MRLGGRPAAIGTWKTHLLAVLVLVTSCTTSGARTYELTGQVVAIDTTTERLTIAHDAIPGYMDAMTMPFKVKQTSGTGVLQPGDLVRGRLIVTSDDGFLESVEKTGHRELPEHPSRTASSAGDFVLEGDRLPDVQLVDQTGSRRRLRDKPGSATVLTFIYTRCPFPTFCPLMDRNFTALQRRIANDPNLVGRVELVSITIDPAHDTPSVLRQHAERLEADPAIWSFVVAEESTPGAFAGRFGVAQKRETSDPTLIVHNLATVVVDPAGVVARIFRGNEWTVEQVTDLLELETARHGGRR